MGLKITDALRLSWSNISQYKKRSAIIVLTVSILLSMVMAFSLIAQGLQGTVLQTALENNDGKIYVQVSYQEIASFNEGDFTKVDSLADPYKKLEELVAPYHGKIIGKDTVYQVDTSRSVINQELAERLSKLDVGKLADGQVAYLAPEAESEQFYRYLYPDGVRDTRLVKVGTYTTTQAGSPTLPGLNPLNLILSKVSGSSDFATPVFIDDNDGRMQAFIQAEAEKQAEEFGLETAEEYFEKIWTPRVGYVVMFDDYSEAARFYQDCNGGKILPKDIVDSAGKKYNLIAYEDYGSVIGSELAFKNLQKMFTTIGLLFIVIAVVIATLTFAHLIDQDAATVALYRAMGASTRNIYLIYFLYLLELCILAILACILIAGVFVGIVWLFNAGALAERLKEYYSLKALPKINMLGFNKMVLWIIGAILAVAPLTLLFTMRRFSAKHIAKKLKED